MADKMTSQARSMPVHPGKLRSPGRPGSILVVVLIMTAVIAGLAIAYVLAAVSRQTQVNTAVENQDVYYTAVAGFEMARDYLLSKYTPHLTGYINAGWSHELQISSAGAKSEPSSKPSNVSSYAQNYQTWIQQNGKGMWDHNIAYYKSDVDYTRNNINYTLDTNWNTFRVHIENNAGDTVAGAQNDTDNIVKLTVTAWTGGNTAWPKKPLNLIQIEGMVQIDKYIPPSALVVGGNNGAPMNQGVLKLLGQQTGFSGNGQLGSLQAQGGVLWGIPVGGAPPSAVTSTYTIAGFPPVVQVHPNSQVDDIPENINPAYYQSLTDYTLSSKAGQGMIIANSTGQAFTVNIGMSFHGWSWGGSNLWQYANDIVYDGSYYCDSNVEIAGSPGTITAPWSLTLFANGYIKVTGAPCIQPKVEGIALFSGRDMILNGSDHGITATRYSGVYFASEQVLLQQFVPNSLINGALIIKNFRDGSSTDPFNNIVPRNPDYNVSLLNLRINYALPIKTCLVMGTKVIGLRTVKQIPDVIP